MITQELAFIAYCFFTGCLWVTLIGRYFYFANKYENHLNSHYPDVAARRKSDPLCPITWKAFPVFSSPLSEAELKDEFAIKLRRKARVSLILAFLIPIFSPLLGYGIRLLMGGLLKGSDY